jgi:hypothetical protein
VNDFLQLASNAYRMRVVPLDLTSLILLVCTVLLPFVPVVLMTVPLEVFLAQLKDLLL